MPAVVIPPPASLAEQSRTMDLPDSDNDDDFYDAGHRFGSPYSKQENAKRTPGERIETACSNQF